MLSVTYLSLGGVGLLIYREYRKKARADERAAGEDHSCPDHSTDETS